jgi:hypothetical protein
MLKLKRDVSEVPTEQRNILANNAYKDLAHRLGASPFQELRPQAPARPPEVFVMFLVTDHSPTPPFAVAVAVAVCPADRMQYPPSSQWSVLSLCCELYHLSLFSVSPVRVNFRRARHKLRDA